MHAVEHNIVSSDRFQVDYFQSQNSRERLLFSFTEFGNRQTKGYGFGGKFALENGFDLISVKSNSDDWHHSIQPETFERVEQFLTGLPTRHTWRAAYGSSAGAYAAVLFAGTIKANAVFALSPQFDITQAWDKRWAAQAASLPAMRTLDRDMVQPGCRYVIGYDPADPDRLHFERFAEVIPPELLSAVRVPHAGHPVGRSLSDAGILKEIALSVLSGAQIPDVPSKYRAKRRDSPEYFFNLSGHCLRRRKTRWAKSVISKAVALQPQNAEFAVRSALTAEACGDLDTAIPYAALSVAVAPRNPHMTATLSRLLYRKGLHKQALHYIEIAINLAPNVAAFVKQRSEVLAALG